MKKVKFFLSLFSLVLLVAVLSFGAEAKAELVLLNGKIATVDKNDRVFQALAVREDKILALGTDNQMRRYIVPATRVIDLQGKLAIPGFIDSHGHFLSLGYAQMELDLTRARNWEEIVALVADAVRQARPGQWIIGRGWHQEKWDHAPQPSLEGLPLHQALDSVSPRNPVYLTHASGHSCLVNAKAMELAGISKDTANPPGGEILRDSQGQPIGAFREMAMDLVSRAMNWQRSLRSEQEQRAETEKAALLAQEECLIKGVTGFHDAGVSFSTVDLYRQLIAENRLHIRLFAMLSENNQALKKRIAQYRIIGLGDNRLTVRAIKRFMDGALGSHGAWLLEPYASLPGSTGLNTESLEIMAESARIALENDFQLCTHAIGDRGNRETLNVYEEAFRSAAEKKERRWRIEHAQHLNPADIPRFAGLGVIASMQGIHCTSDGPWVIKRLGEKRAREGAYVWRKLLDTGAIICNGTDVPVEGVDPLPNFYALVTRRLQDGSYFFPDQRMSRLEALRSYTYNGAYAAFEEGIKGSLEPGKLADIVVLSGDILTMPAEEILKTRVLYTILGGKIVYQNPELAVEKGRVAGHLGGSHRGTVLSGLVSAISHLIGTRLQ